MKGEKKRVGSNKESERGDYIAGNERIEKINVVVVDTT